LPDARPESESPNPKRIADPALPGTRLIDPDTPDLSEPRFAASLEADRTLDSSSVESSALKEPTSEETAPSVSHAASDARKTEVCNSEPQDSLGWREELAAKLNRYQARRKPRPPRYPSLRLRFEDEESDRHANAMFAESSLRPAGSGAASCQALALDSLASQPEAQMQVTVPDPSAENAVEALGAVGLPRHATQAPDRATEAAIAPPTAKIIEFPRSWSAPPPPLDELAEPVIDRPRILEAPAIAPPLPALGGITIEAPEKQAAEKRLGIDIPLQTAPLIQRILAAVLDAVIVAGACALFAFVFWKIAAVRPPRFLILGLVAGLGGLFWAASQYLLIVYSGATPGLLLARLELTRFDGTPVSRRLRRWRVLASFLSAASLGMGYLWVFLDEDALCWHDRITHTYLAPRRQEREGKSSSVVFKIAPHPSSR